MGSKAKFISSFSALVIVTLSGFAAEANETRKAHLLGGRFIWLTEDAISGPVGKVRIKTGSPGQFVWQMEGSWNTQDSAYVVHQTSLFVERTDQPGWLKFTFQGKASQSGGASFRSNGAALAFELLDRNRRNLRVAIVPIDAPCGGAAFTKTIWVRAEFDDVVELRHRDNPSDAVACSGDYVAPVCVNNILGPGCEKKN